MNTLALTQIPHANHATTITADQFRLIGVDDHVVDREVVPVVALKAAAADVPDLDRAVLGAGHHPLALTVKSNPGHIIGVPLKGHQGLRVAGLGIVELHIVVTRDSQVSLVGGDAQPIDLGIRVLDGPGADSRKCLPEAKELSYLKLALTLQLPAKVKRDGHALR